MANGADPEAADAGAGVLLVRSQSDFQRTFVLILKLTSLPCPRLATGVDPDCDRVEEVEDARASLIKQTTTARSGPFSLPIFLHSVVRSVIE